MIMGLVRPEGGRILLKGRNITHEPMYYRARLGVGYLAQEPSIFRRLTVQENLAAILELREGTFDFVDNYKGTRAGKQRLFPIASVLAGKKTPARA